MAGAESNGVATESAPAASTNAQDKDSNLEKFGAQEKQTSNGDKASEVTQGKGQENNTSETAAAGEKDNVQSSPAASKTGAASNMVVIQAKKNPNGAINASNSVFTGNKIKHLKKEDGIPLWRKDIQYAFLRAVFEDDTKAFTHEDGTKGHSFADIYIDAMAKSPKTSKVLRDKLLSDREAAANMAMVCLLVNIGRMNTTLNFFPEMKAQLRTYHPIPCLQVHQDQNSQYKGLQDAPRLKSILKGSCEDPNQPNTIEKLQKLTVPRTNPVNLIFILQQWAPRISEMHFVHPTDFFDLVIRGTLSSRSRAKAFLWLCWWYLESDFSEEAALNNPFGPGSRGEDESSPPFKVPVFDHLTEEQADQENVDTEEEIAYGEKMRLVRKRILDEDEASGHPAKRGSRLGDSLEAASPARSDLEATRSPSPSSQTPLRMPKPRRGVGLRNTLDEDSIQRSDVEGRSSSGRIIFKSKSRAANSSSPVQASGARRGGRAETSHQRAVNRNRRMRIECVLHKRLSEKQAEARKERRAEGKTRSAARTLQAMKRVVTLSDAYDTDEEDAVSLANGTLTAETVILGPGGLVPLAAAAEPDDFGGEAKRRQKVFDRAARRFTREEARRDPFGDAAADMQRLLRKRKELHDAEADAANLDESLAGWRSKRAAPARRRVGVRKSAGPMVRKIKREGEAGGAGGAGSAGAKGGAGAGGEAGAGAKGAGDDDGDASIMGDASVLGAGETESVAGGAGRDGDGAGDNDDDGGDNDDGNDEGADNDDTIMDDTDEGDDEGVDDDATEDGMVE